MTEKTDSEDLGLLRGVLAETLLRAVGRGNLPNAFHLLAAGVLAHQRIVECVLALLILRRPGVLVVKVIHVW
jgi:hypothetical protein